MRGGIAILCAVGLAALAGCGDDSAPSPTTAAARTTAGTGSGRGGIELVKIGDFEQPLYLTQAPGSDDLYVVQKTGQVMVVRGGKTLPEPFLDLSDRVSTDSEEGLLSIAFAPDFEDSRLLYAYYSDADGYERVSEFRAPDDEYADPGSEREVLVMDDFAPNHNGGLIVFGPDGHLYIGTGDGGLEADPHRTGQDLGSLQGKLLRIDPSRAGARPYSVPAGNPFVTRPGARPEIYSYGLRNPWRFSFDRRSGAIAIGDVGQNAFEEVDYLSRADASGANFGWSAYEGDARFNRDQSAPGRVPPVLTYSHDRGCSVTGGYVVRDPGLPSLYGRYLYGDYCTGELRSFVPAAGGARDDRSLALSVPALSSFGADAAEHLYAASLEGQVFRLCQASAAISQRGC
jgi:glucose/arabinose dehydrogenase